MMRSGFVGGLLVAWLLVGLPARAEPRTHEAPWYVPDHAALQFAGSIGMLAAGPGWAFLDEQVDVQALLGWAPRAVAGADFVTLTLKAQWHPFLITHRDWRIRPLTVGAAFSYTFGDRYFLKLPDRYDSGYYWFTTALRPMIFLGGSVGHSLPERGAPTLEGYYELVATDYRLVQFVQNPGTVNTGLFSLALGARLRF